MVQKLMNLTASYDPSKDAENHVRAIFDSAYITHGRENMRKKLLSAVEMDAIRSALTVGGDRSEVLVTVNDLLAKSPARASLANKAQKLESSWTELGRQVIFQLEALYVQEWPFESVSVDLTTLPVCPYDYEARRIFVHAQPSIQTQLRILSHELNHFMFYRTYAEGLTGRLDREQFELLKESVTIFTNPEQAGKPNEERLRKLFVEKHVRNLDDAVKLGAKYLEDTNGQ